MNLDIATKCQGIHGQAALLSVTECGDLALSSNLSRNAPS